MRRLDFLTYFGAFLSSLLLISCASETHLDIDFSSPSAQEMIHIVGGKPSGLSLSSRGAPSQMGVCNADRLQIWVYSGTSSKDKNNPTLDQITNSSELNTIDGLRFGGQYFNDKVTTCPFTAQRDNSVRVGFIFPACAYTQSEKNNFEFFNTSNVQNLGINVTNNTKTPELYFGKLYFKTSETGTDSVFHWKDNYMSILRKIENSITHKNEPNPEGYLFGELYRIVSQLNLTITDVDIANVERLEMYVSNFPTTMTLFGNHGDFYHVSVASGESQHSYSTPNDPSNPEKGMNNILVASTDKFEYVKDKYNTDKTIEKYTYQATLSTFLLPSDIGRSLKVRIHYKPGTLTDNDGNALPIQYEDFDIRPSDNYFITGEDAAVYKEGVKKKNNDIYIYDQVADEFFSVANTKVNLSGKFENIFAPTQNIDVQIEVCPSFEAVHNFSF